jgi:tetratricopeptide (TPR) repeat protein
VTATWHPARRRQGRARGLVCAIAALAGIVTAAAALFSCLPLRTQAWLYAVYIEPFADRLGLTQCGALNHAGRCLDDGDLDGAMKWANRTIAYDPEFFLGYDIRGRVHDLRGKYDLAIDDYTVHICRTSTADRDILALRGRVYERIGKRDPALEDYRAALLPPPGRTSCLLDLAAERIVGRQIVYWDRLRAFARSHPGECLESIDEMMALFDDAISRHPGDKDLQECRSLLGCARQIAAARAERGDTSDY